jgi:t-SNARE complex subunit (syntaxin)
MSLEESLEKLEADVLQLKQTMDMMHDVVLDQKPSLNHIEDFIAESKKEVVEAAPVIQEAASYSSYLYYIAASVGTTVLVLVFL